MSPSDKEHWVIIKKPNHTKKHYKVISIGNAALTGFELSLVQSIVDRAFGEKMFDVVQVNENPVEQALTFDGLLLTVKQVVGKGKSPRILENGLSQDYSCYPLIRRDDAP